VKKTKLGDTIKELCTKCGNNIVDCTCFKLDMTAEWPRSGNNPRSEGEMSDRFGKLKEAGSGTIFLSLSGAPSLTAPTSIDLAPEAIIGGVYRIIRLIGRGGMGEVYLAKHLTLNKKCALKVIPPVQVTEIGWQRFQLEAKTVAKLQHVNIVRVTDLGIHDECLPFYAMDYIDGSNLAEVLAEDGPLELNRALEIFMQVCDGVDCAHRSGLLHRDLKPANIMLTQPSAGKLEVKILDFGLAKLTKHDRMKQSLTSAGEVFGSPNYMSPEQGLGTEIDARSDIYSLGCTLFKALTGQPPFSGGNAFATILMHQNRAAPTLDSAAGGKVFPPQLESIMAKLLRKNPDERYQTLSELKLDLELIARGQNMMVVPVSEEKEAVAADREPTDREQTDSEQTYVAIAKPARPQMPLLMALGAIILIATGSCIYYQIASRRAIETATSPKPVSRAVAISPIVLSPAEKAAAVGSEPDDASDSQRLDAEDKWDGTPFYKGLVLKDGKQFQHWSYKTDQAPLVSLGFEGARGPQRTALSGDLYIPATAKVSLIFRQEPIYPSNRIKALIGGNFDEVNFGRYSLKDVEAIAPTLARSKSIKGIRLGDSDWSIEDSRASVEVINQFPNLERLALSAKYEGSNLARITRLRALKELRLSRSQPYLHDCLKVITGSNNLLCLGASNWTVPSSDLEMVVKCPNLQELLIGQLTGSHEQFAILAQLPGLQLLDMPALRYRPDLLADLRLLKALKGLKFSVSSEWNDTQIVELRHDLPNVHISTYSGFRGGHRRSDEPKFIEQPLMH
jgi:serine/threonine-protein kinase